MIFFIFMIKIFVITCPKVDCDFLKLYVLFQAAIEIMGSTFKLPNGNQMSSS